ncbi:MAG: (deoxy)nucleoside triphosphate pyrophosphohydrolase [Ignavibacteriales bacterium]|nr:(deoxy)nucleoside triphosphate pyrophosphohydrolase [Ignavibacteriales bacterium]
MIKVAVGIIFRNKTELLLCQRKPHLPYPLKWEFPGGKVITGETMEECLHRELKEELEINAVIGRLYHSQEYVYSNSGTFNIFYYLITSYSGEIINKVFESHRWIPISELSNYDILEGNKDVIEKLLHIKYPA